MDGWMEEMRMDGLYTFGLHVNLFVITTYMYIYPDEKYILLKTPCTACLTLLVNRHAPNQHMH